MVFHLSLSLWELPFKQCAPPPIIIKMLSLIYMGSRPKKDKNKCFKPVRLEMIQHHWNSSHTNKKKRLIQTVNWVWLYHVFISTAQYIIIYSFIVRTFLNRSVTLIAASVPRFVYTVDLLSSTPILPWCYGGKVHYVAFWTNQLTILQFFTVYSFWRCWALEWRISSNWRVELCI